MSVLLIIIGIVLVLWGADSLTDGATALATRMKVPQIVIGLTVVAFGTSMPEFSVSLMSAIKGTSDMAVGNVVGSNIFNALLIVGLAALVSPIIISKNTVKKDMPYAIGASVMLLVLCLDNEISRIDACLLLLAFALFMAYTLHIAKTDAADSETVKPMKTLKAIGFIALGLAGLIVGSNFFVDGATKVAQSLGVSDAIIGLTIVAGGTSLPELATSVMAAHKGQSAIAIGNIIGSNVFNILMILGFTGLLLPMDIQGITQTDMVVLVGSILLLWFFTFTKYKVERWEGAVLVASYAAYMAWLIYNI